LHLQNDQCWFFDDFVTVRQRGPSNQETVHWVELASYYQNMLETRHIDINQQKPFFKHLSRKMQRSQLILTAEIWHGGKITDILGW
jgi:hypothetical protein